MGNLTRQQATETAQGWFDLSAGFLVLVEASTTGGRRVEKLIDGDEIISKRRIDPMVKESNKLTTKIHYRLNENAVWTPIGYFTDAKGLQAIRKKWVIFEAIADDLNEKARAIGSDHRVKLGLFVLELRNTQEPQINKRFAEIVRDNLQTLLNILSSTEFTSGQRGFQSGRAICQALDKLAIGEARHLIQKAVACYETRRRQLVLMRRAGVPLDEVRKKLDLKPLQNAIAFFSLGDC